jgi:NAD(P)-dependent dehydrogenase (short-subunit alcohol dehydrogenase family)
MRLLVLGGTHHVGRAVVEAALARGDEVTTGFACRPVEETVAGTWAWLQAEGDPPPRPGRPAHGLDPQREQRALALAASS